MPKQLRALQIIGDSKFGGDSVIICDWLDMLTQRGLRATLLATDPPVVELARERGLDVWTFEGIQRPIDPCVDIPAILRLSRLLRRRFDVVHTNTTKGGAVGRPAAWLAGVPAVLHTVHGFAFHEFSGKLTTTVYSNIERVLTKMCHRVIFVNEFDRQRAIDMGVVPERKAVTVYNGVAEDRLADGRAATREQLLAELDLPADARLASFVGRLAEQKGPRYMFEAFAAARRKLPDTPLHLAVVGDGELAGKCRQWVTELNLTDRVHFLGFRTDAVRWIGGADLFVLSSLWEGHSITLLEAMGCGRPCVATDIKGNRESITHGIDGLLVAPADSESLSDALVRLAANRPEAERLGREARATFDRRFTLRQMLASTWTVYEDLLRERRLR